MAGQFCHSCTAPLDLPQFKSAAKEYCVHCVDEGGELLPKNMVLDGIAHWLKSWQGKISDAVAHERATHFMKAMPAWANASAGKNPAKKVGAKKPVAGKKAGAKKSASKKPATAKRPKAKKRAR